MTPRPHLDTARRRARLVARHHLRRSAATIDDAVRDLVAVHSSDPITPPLALWARVPHVTVADVEDAVAVTRSLWRLHAMRRTLFLAHVRDAPMLLAAASRGVSVVERRKLERWVAEALPDVDAPAHITALEEATVTALADGRPQRTQDLSGLVDGLGVRLEIGAGAVPLASRVPFLLALDARLVRTASTGTWISSQYRWAERRSWFGDAVCDEELVQDAEAARGDLVRAYLRAHGPATSVDVGWWTGWGKRVTARALAAGGAVEAALDDGATGWVLAEDVDAGAGAGDPAAEGVALLPGLDPTVMGWKERDWYLGAHAARLFDTNGNAGPTVWVDGRVVGGWAVHPSGAVVTRLLEPVGAAQEAAVEAEAAALTAWLDGVTPTPRFRTPLERELSR